MKRNLIILVVLLGMLVLSGCTTGPVQEPEILPEESEDSVTQIELGPNEFMLASLPDLEPFTPYTEISDRFYEEYTDHLIPRKDYGRLYPFAGKVRTDSNRYTVDVRYGLCDAEGRVVVDPVYSYWNIFEVGEQKIIALYRQTEEIIESAVGEQPVTLLSLAASDGSWVTEEREAYVVGQDEQAIVIASVQHYLLNEETGEAISDETQTVYIYDLQGVLQRTVENVTPMGYNQGTLAVFTEQGGQVQDLEGKVILSGLYAPRPFYGEYAPVGIGQQEYVLMDRQGNYDPEHVYSYLYFDSAAEMYQFDTLDNMHGYVDLSGNVIVRTQGSIYMCEDEYTGHTILEEKNYETSTYAVTDLDTGASMTRVISDGTMNYLGNGWVQCTFRVDGNEGQEYLELYHLEEDMPQEAVYSIEGGGYCDLLEKDLLVISGIAQPIAEDAGVSIEYAPQSSTLLFDLQNGTERARISGSVNWVVPGLGIMIQPPNDWLSSNLYGADGQRLLEGRYYSVQEAGDGYWAVAGTRYAGLVDKQGQWVIRYCINTTD